MSYYRYKCPRGHTYNAGGWYRWPKDVCKKCGYTEEDGEGPIWDCWRWAINKADLNES